MRFYISATLLFACIPAPGQGNLPAWLSDPKGFCVELANRANGSGARAPIGRPKSVGFADYAVRLAAPQRPAEAVISKHVAFDEQKFAQAVKSAVSSGPDFAGRFAIIRWTCGTWCSNNVIADVMSGRTYDPPFLGAIGCKGTTGSFDTIERRADSSLMIVRGSLEMTFGDSFSEGPCGVFYFRWETNRLRLIGCEIERER
jgi:hypothetical protein